jgi:hypothetical protein
VSSPEANANPPIRLVARLCQAWHGFEESIETTCSGCADAVFAGVREATDVAELTDLWGCLL